MKSEVVANLAFVEFQTEIRTDASLAVVEEYWQGRCFPALGNVAAWQLVHPTTFGLVVAVAAVVVEWCHLIVRRLAQMRCPQIVVVFVVAAMLP